MMGLAQTDALFRKVARSVLWSSVIVLAVQIVITVADVLGRFLFNRPIPGVVDASELFLPYILFIPLAYTLATGTHVRMSLATSRMAPPVRRASEVFANLVGLVFFAVLTMRAWRFFWDSFVIGETMLAPIYLPWFLGKLALPIGTALITVQFLLHLGLSLRPERAIQALQPAREEEALKELL